MQRKRIRYAVAGLGHFAQVAILPAFARSKNSELVALFSGDEQKRRELAERYEVAHAYPYDDYDAFLRSGSVDAVYIALPNSMHCEYTVRAARAGVHVLCEKPMALDERECLEMIDACHESRVKLMIGYRLHFEEANLSAVEIAKSGRIGEPHLFTSTFTMQVKPDNIRLDRELGGGPLYDIGVYCINAARYLFRHEPSEAICFASAHSEDPRFREVPEEVAALLRFPSGKLATFAISFGAADVSRYELVGTLGKLVVEPAFDYSQGLRHELFLGGKVSKKSFKKRDQIAAELVYFSSCILDDVTPEPSGHEGLADVRVIRALKESAESGRSVAIESNEPVERPDLDQEEHVRPHGVPDLVNVEAPSR